MNSNYTSANLDELISNVIYGYYVKYDTLAGLINTNYSGSNATTIDIYIDMQDILRHIDNQLIRMKMSVQNPLLITSGLINMIAHYRNFFTTRFKCNSRFWLIDSYENYLAILYYSQFKTKPLSPTMVHLYRENLQFIPMLCNVIPDVQYERCSVDITTRVLSIRNIEKTDNPGLIISKDSFVFQASVGGNVIGGDIRVLRPRKNNLGDISFIVSANNVIECYIISLAKKPINMNIYIDPEQISVLMAMTRVPSRNLKTFYQLTTAMDRLRNVYSSGLTTKYPWVQNEFANSVIMINKDKKNPAELLYRMQACDTVFTQLAAYSGTAECDSYKGIVNIYDPEGVKEINNKYFSSCPLDLNVL